MKKEENKKKTTKKGTSKKETTPKETKKNTSTKKKQETNKKIIEKKEQPKIKVEAKKVEEKVVEEVSVMEEPSVKKEVKKPKISGDILLILGLVIVVVLGFVVMKGEKPVPGYELPLTLSGEAGLHQLTYQEYQEKIDNDEEFVVILERATCSHCVTFMPIAESFASENELPMYYVDTDTFSEDEWDSFQKSNSYLKQSNGDWGTPTTVVLAGFETVGYVEGATDAENLLNLYKEYFDMGEE